MAMAQARFSVGQPLGPGVSGPGVKLVAPDAAETARRTAEATANLQQVEAYWNGLGVDGVDGAGAQPTIVIDPTDLGAYADIESRDSALHIGRDLDGTWFSGDLATIAHEYTHFVIKHAADASPVRARWNAELDASALAGVRDAKRKHWGALRGELARQDHLRMLKGEFLVVHEGLADIMAAGMTHQWKVVNRDASTGANMIHDAAAYEAPASDTADVRTSAREQHYASGIVSTAGYRVQQQLGWTHMEQIFLHTMQDPRFTDAVTFGGLARIAIDEARSLYGDADAEVVATAFRANGVQPD